MDDKKDALLQPDPNKDPNAAQDAAKKDPDPSDNLTPDHPRFKEVIKQNHELKDTVESLQTKLDSIEKSIKNRQQETGDDELTDEEKKSLAIIDRELKRKGYITREDKEEDDRINSIATQLEKLTDKFDGKGDEPYPKFVAEEVAAHAKKLGTDNMEEAYYSLHRQAIIQVEAKRLTKAPVPPTSERPTAATRVITGDITPEKVAKMSPSEYEKNREKIKEAMNPRKR